MKPRLLAALTALLLAALPLGADSPLTSTDLAGAYGDLAVVREAGQTRRVAGEVARFLVGDHPIDRKAAVVNALGWEAPGNALSFLRALAEARGVALDDLQLAHLTAADRFVLGYLLALETYLEPAPLKRGALDLWGATPYQLLDQAAQALPRDFTVHYVRGLLEAQRAAADSGCSAYLATQRVLEGFPAARRNLRPKAVATVQSYMELYKSDCGQAPLTPAAAARRPLDPQHDQIYALARLQEWIVAGTQAGVVVWRADQRQPVAWHDARICADVLAWGESVWAGCYGRLVRWDGRAWKSYLQDPQRSDGAYVPMRGPAGELLVRHGSSEWRYDPQRDAFAAVDLDLGDDPFDVLFRRNGDAWRIDFLKAVVGPQRTWLRGSSEYPGRDPRSLAEDGDARLWVLDFEDGAFRLDEGRFVRQPGLDEKASSIAVDTTRGRTWLLHYNRGLFLLHDGTVATTIDLSDHEYLRDVLLDERSGEVWVAGWKGLVRIRESPRGWSRDDWRVSAGQTAKPKPPRRPARRR